MTKTNAPLRAARYARISETDKKRDKVEDQLRDLQALADRRGYVVVKTFTDDGISALDHTKERPGWTALLAAVLNGEVDIILATEEERFARNVKDKAELQLVCIDVGAVWETIRDGHVDPSTESGEFFSTMRAAMGRMESRRKAARQKAANEARASVGRPNPGRRRYGYELDGMTPREAEAAIVRRMFDHVAGGGSVHSLSQALNAEGHRTVTGGIWRPARLRDVLLNPHYHGAMKHLDKVIPSEFITPIVDPEKAAQVHAILRDPSRTTSPGPKVRHLLSGLARCGADGCGARLFFMRDYRCRVSTAHPCIRKPFLEEAVRDAVALAFLTGGPDLVPSSEPGVSVASLLEDYTRNERAVATIIEDREEGLITPALARVKLKELKAARESIEAALERARTEKGAASALLEIAQGLLVREEVPMSEWATMKTTVLDRFDALDLDRQREVVRALLHIEVHSGRDTRQRVRITHLLATHLNPDAEEALAAEARYFTD